MGERLRLGGRILDLHAQTLSDAQGQPVAMRPQAFAVLALLARHAGEVVTKERLLDAVWPGLIVTDGSIAQAVSDVRAALGEAGHELIRTIARRGYLLVGAEPEPEPVLAAHAAPPALPAMVGELFGRGPELHALRVMLARHRLVTVFGAGGVGKTVVALAAAHDEVRRSPRAVGWVDLAPIADPALLPGTIARALDLPVNPLGDALPGLLRGLRSIEALVVLDNAEHLVDAVAVLARAMLDAAPGLRLLVTSQAALRLDAERLLRLSTLPFPQPGDPFEEAVVSPAVALFVDRARALDSRFELTPENAESIGRLCRRLDGLPLAIKLAASRVHMLGLSSLELHLDDRFQWLSQASRDVPDRQRTLLAALHWSYGLLSSAEQRRFRLLGCFVGGFGPEMAAAMVQDEPRSADIAGLVERSLVTIEPGDPPRYRLLESQRAFALRELERLGEADQAKRHHAHAVERVMFDAAEVFWSTPDLRWMARWAVEVDNLRAAMKWSEANDPALCASMVGSATGLYRLLDLGHELRRQADAVDVDAVERAGPAMAARFWLARAYLRSTQSAGDTFDCAVRAEQLARAAGDGRYLYMALCQKGLSTHVSHDEALALLVETAQLESPQWPARLRSQRWMAAFSMHNMAGQWREALAAAESGFALVVEAGAVLPQTLFANWIVVALLGLGEAPAAEARSREVEACVMRAPMGLTIPFMGTCARVALANGDVGLARQRLARMIELSRKLEWLHFDVFADLYLGLALAEGCLEEAARLLGFAEVATQRAWRVKRSRRSREAARARLEQALGAERLAQLCDEGTQLGAEAVSALLMPPLH